MKQLILKKFCQLCDLFSKQPKWVVLFLRTMYSACLTQRASTFPLNLSKNIYWSVFESESKQMAYGLTLMQAAWKLTRIQSIQNWNFSKWISLFEESRHSFTLFGHRKTRFPLPAWNKKFYIYIHGGECRKSYVNPELD